MIICDKGFIWNPSNCECECDKSCHVGEYLDYEYCKCRKKLVDKLVEECSENIDENEMTHNDYGILAQYTSYYFSLFLIIIGISSASIYFHWHLKKSSTNITNINPDTETMGNIKQINIKNCTYYYFNGMINIKNFDLNLLKIDKKNHTKTLLFITLVTSQ